MRGTPSAAGPFCLLGLPFRGLGASILTFWETIVAPREHPRGPFLAFRDHGRGPWEQQDGLEMIFHRISFYFEVILGPAYISFFEFEKLKMSIVFSDLVPGCFLNRFLRF